jgi:hypothetical protein
MTHVAAFLHFIGVGILVGGELLIAMIAIRAQKDDTALAFFVGFLYRIAAFMWVGVGLATAGGVGLILTLDYPFSGLFILKLVLVGVVIAVSLQMLLGLPKVRAAAAEDFLGLRSHRQFRQLDLISRINLLLILVIVVVSVVM